MMSVLPGRCAVAGRGDCANDQSSSGRGGSYLVGMRECWCRTLVWCSLCCVCATRVLPRPRASSGTVGGSLAIVLPFGMLAMPGLNFYRKNHEKYIQPRKLLPDR